MVYTKLCAITYPMTLPGRAAACPPKDQQSQVSQKDKTGKRRTLWRTHSVVCRRCKATYENAIKAGDKNVYFIDGETFFGETDRELCTLDRVHPNDLGFSKMASVVEPVIKSILEKNDI